MAYTTIDDPSAYFHTRLYSGNNSGSGLAITNNANAGDFQPDWVWIKRRDSSGSHGLHDSNRGSTKRLKSDANEAEDTNSNILASFDSNGFTIGDNSGNYNASGTYVAWQWKANGGTTTSISASGSGATQIIASTHQANTTAGFSIVTFTAPSVGSGNDFTISHGLGAVPDMIITRSRSDAGNWHVYHQATGRLGATFLNLTNAFTDAEYFGDTNPTSTVFSHSEGAALDAGMTAIAYCFTSIQGYSKFGSYTGNGSTNGTFVYTGFKPAWIMIKRTSDGGNDWIVIDTTRFTSNVITNYIRANTSDAETDQYNIDEDILSNGFKLRGNSGNINASGSPYIYMAFAEHPFVSSKGVPATAR
jgi:hypothetical protein